VRKQRGSRTHGWGQIGQHRKTGAKGGRGMAGGHKHKWTSLMKMDYFGKSGFINPTSREEKAVNIDELQALVEKSRGSPAVINLAEMGVVKLLGKGRLSLPAVVAVQKWTKKAESKIVSVGGRVVQPSDLAKTEA